MQIHVLVMEQCRAVCACRAVNLPAVLESLRQATPMELAELPSQQRQPAGLVLPPPRELYPHLILTVAEVGPALSVQHLDSLQELGHARRVLGVDTLDHVFGVYRRVEAVMPRGGGVHTQQERIVHSQQE